eukprot:329639-Pyramimonas_sp.AAC.1
MCPRFSSVSSPSDRTASNTDERTTTSLECVPTPPSSDHLRPIVRRAIRMTKALSAVDSGLDVCGFGRAILTVRQTTPSDPDRPADNSEQS